MEELTVDYFVNTLKKCDIVVENDDQLYELLDILFGSKRVISKKKDLEIYWFMIIKWIRIMKRVEYRWFVEYYLIKYLRVEYSGEIETAVKV